MKKQMSAWLVLMIITLVAGLALGATYTLTKPQIDAQSALAEENSRKAAVPLAEEFAAIECGDLDWCYEGKTGGETVGYAAQVTVNGFGGEVEIIAGIDAEGKITMISVGGSNFSETPGLGAKSKDEAFTAQFAGKTCPLTVVKAGEPKADDTVDAITSATITSRAVTGGVNRIAEFVASVNSGK